MGTTNYMKAWESIKFHFRAFKMLLQFHFGAVSIIIRSKIRDVWHLRRVDAKNAHAIYIGYRDEKLKNTYKAIKQNAEIGHTSTSILLQDKETTEQFKHILEKDGYLIRVEEKGTHNFKYELTISWSTLDLTPISSLLE